MISTFGRIISSGRAGAALLLVWIAIGFLGCEGTKDVQGTAKEVPEEQRYHYEGTGKAKTKVLNRRKEERQKALSEAAKKTG